jgi:hypothetical protein
MCEELQGESLDGLLCMRIAERGMFARRDGVEGRWCDWRGQIKVRDSKCTWRDTK